MVQYLCNRIISGALTYDYVISKRPDLKEDIDSYLIAHNREDLITPTEEVIEE